MNRRASAALVALLALAVLAGTTPVATADSHNATSYDRLSEDGTHYDRPSARIADQRVWWLSHRPADSPWSNEKKLVDRELIQSNTLFLNTIRVSDEPATRTVKIAFWQKGSREVQDGNTTRTAPAAENVSVVERQITLGKGWPEAALDLPQHNDVVRMTIWIEGASDEARWTLKHQSIATSAAASNIQTQGDLVGWGLTNIVGPAVLLTMIVGWAVKRALDEAGIGPQWGYSPWLILLTVVTGGGVLLFYDSLATVFVNLPYVLAGYLAGIAGIVILETHTQDVHRALFLRPEVQGAVSPSGQDAVDMQRATVREERILKRSNRRALVSKGLRPFLARVFGGYARLRGAEEVETEIQLDECRWDELFIVDPQADSILEYDSEGWTWTANTTLIYGAVGLAAVGGLWFGSAATAVAGTIATFGAAALMWARPTSPEAWIQPAPVHLRSAWASMLFLAEEADVAKTIKEARKKNVKLSVQNEQDVERELEEKDQTLVEEMFGSDVEDKDPDDERVERILNGDLDAGGADD